MKKEQFIMKNAAGITRTKFERSGNEIKVAFQTFETPLLRPEVPLLSAEIGPLDGKSRKNEHF
jgi:hypothetical protein